MQSPYTPPTNPAPEVQSSGTEKSSTGPLIGAAIIIVVLALGAFYFWGARLNNPNGNTDQLPLIPEEAASENSDWMPEENSSDAAADIQADLEATDMSQFEQDMNADASAANSQL